MSSETINVSVKVNGATPPPNPLVIKDAAGNVLADGADVTLQPETIGVNDPGQVVCVISGGTSPYTFTPSGNVPDGMELGSVANADGSESVLLAGTPAADAVDSNFSIVVADSSTPTPQIRRLGVSGPRK